MVTVKKDNAQFIVSDDEVDTYLERGFSIVGKPEEGGGDATVSPSPMPDDEKMEPVDMQVIVDNPLMLNGRYWNQLNKAELREICTREGVSFLESDSVPNLRIKFGKYAKSVKKKK